MAIRLNLDQPTSEEETAILFSVNHPGVRRFRISSQQRILPKDWNADGQQARRSHRNYGNLNRTLGDRKREIEDALAKLQAQKIPITKESVHRLLSWRVEKIQIQQAIFAELIDQFIAHRKSTGKVKAITVSGYDATFNVVKEYMRVKDVQLDIHTFGEDDFNHFRAYCHIDRGNKNNGFDKTAKNLGVFLRWCKERGFTQHDGAKAIERTKSKKEINPLLPEELITLERAEGVFTGQYEDVRKMFLMQVYTGLRIKDIKDLSASSVKSSVIVTTTSKTHTAIKIPIITRARAILNYYLPHARGTVFPDINDQVYNRYLKKIFDDLGLKREVTQVTYKGREMEKTTRRLCDVISSHDGRRTFITLSLAGGMNAWQLMKVTGHENFDSFKKYVHFSETEIAERLVEVWDKI